MGETRDGDDRWWRGLDTTVLEALAPGARVLDVGCGDGGLVDRLAGAGLDAVGADPRAPARPRLMAKPVEQLESVEQFDAACAVMSLHHADLGSVIPAVVRLLRPGGRLFAYELAWEAYDERAAAWLDGRDLKDTDNSVARWRREHAGLHTAAAMRAALGDDFAFELERSVPYLARTLGADEHEVDERAQIEAGSLPALGRLWLATRQS